MLFFPFVVSVLYTQFYYCPLFTESVGLKPVDSLVENVPVKTPQAVFKVAFFQLNDGNFWSL